MLDNYYLTDDNLNKDYINNLGLKKTLAFVKIAVDKVFSWERYNQYAAE